MFLAVKPHLPLISHHIQFTINNVPPPANITMRKDLGRHVKRQVRRSRTPYSRKHTRQPSRGAPSETHSESSLSSLTNSGDEESEDDSEKDTKSDNTKNKIPKPPGEAGRRNSGGFNLEKALGWEQEKYNDLIKYVNEIISGDKLDGRKCFSSQKPESIANTVQLIARKFKIQDAYANNWPVREALKMRLKYTSELFRRQAQKKSERTLKKAVREASASRKGRRGNDDDDDDDDE